MHQDRSAFKRKLGAGVVAAGAMLGAGVLLAVSTGSALGQSAGKSAQGAPKVTTITVTAGKPSELAFKLSKLSNLTPGKFVFKVTNQGLAFHDFKICTKAVTNDKANSCTGKVTQLLHHGDVATLTVSITKKGKYEFMCAVAGHAAAGMKGLIGVGVKVAAPAPTTTTTKTTTTSTTPTTTQQTTTTATTTTATTTTTAGGNQDGCPPGQTIVSVGTGDHDDDDTGGLTDGDGCI